MAGPWACQPGLTDRLFIRVPEPPVGTVGIRVEASVEAQENQAPSSRETKRPSSRREFRRKTENEKLTTKQKGGYTSRPNPIRDGIFAAVVATFFLPKAVARAPRAESFAPEALASAKSRTCLP